MEDESYNVKKYADGIIDTYLDILIARKLQPIWATPVALECAIEHVQGLIGAVESVVSKVDSTDAKQSFKYKMLLVELQSRTYNK